jgi:hypothetical protein
LTSHRMQRRRRSYTVCLTGIILPCSASQNDQLWWTQLIGMDTLRSNQRSHVFGEYPSTIPGNRPLWVTRLTPGDNDHSPVHQRNHFSPPVGCKQLMAIIGVNIEQWVFDFEINATLDSRIIAWILYYSGLVDPKSQNPKLTSV